MSALLLAAAGTARLNLLPGGSGESGVGRPDPGDFLAVAGHGVVLAALGGFRGPAADLLWLEANRAWERREEERTAALLEAVVTVDERPEYFWINGARMMAYDFPTWRTRADAPAAVRAGIERAHAVRALGWLERALRRRGESAGVRIEMARIRWRRLEDPAGAAEDLRWAVEAAGAPDYAVRLRCRLLVKLGRSREAAAWLRSWLDRRGVAGESRTEWVRWWRAVGSSDREP